MHLADVRADLLAEQQSLDEIVGDLTADRWALPTPSPRWTVADQIAHLAYFDNTAALAITDAPRFAGLVADLLAGPASAGDEAADEFMLGPYRALTTDGLLARWRANRAALAAASETLEDAQRIVWYGPSMGAKSFLTARLMECWAHGQDIADALDVTRIPTDRLRHIAQLGFITRNWSYVNRGLEPPSAPIRVQLVAPSGGVWTFGPEGAVESILGPAADFCLVVTQRRHVDDTDLIVSGGSAADWMRTAQAYAGPASEGPPPRS